MDLSNTDVYALSDSAFLVLIGEFVRDNRLTQNRTQQQVAEAAGINRTTLVQMEKGRGVTTLSLVQVLRVLGQLHIFQGFETKQTISPLQLAKAEQQKRKRASSHGFIDDDEIKDQSW